MHWKLSGQSAQRWKRQGIKYKDFQAEADFGRKKHSVEGVKNRKALISPKIRSIILG